MALEKLDNLVKIKQLKKEPPDQNEFDGMVSSAKRRLSDAQIEAVSEEGRFLFPLMVQRTCYQSQPCDGTAIVLIIVI